MHPQPPHARPIRSAGWPDAQIAELVVDQAGNVARFQLLALGVSSGAIKRAVARRRLHRVHAGVYSLLPARVRPPLAAEHAALLACGPAALLSYATAAWLHGLLERRPRGPVELTVVATHRRRPDIEIHRVADLAPHDRARHGRLPVTSVARTLIDLAPATDPRALEAMLDRALRRTSATRIRETIDRHPRRSGTPLLRALLDPARPSADVWSAAERRLLELIRRAGLPLPEANVALGRDTPDLLWRAERVIVEYDSEAHHSGPAARRWDAARHNQLTTEGWRVLHVTWDELDRHPERVLVQIAAALALGAG